MHAPPSAAARTLIDARARRATGPAVEVSDTAAAYAVQRDIARALGWFDAGPPRFWKSGGASRTAVQTHAPLPPDGVLTSPADARALPLRLRLIESEIALRLGVDVDAARVATLDAAGAAALVDAMAVSIEIVESRWDEGLGASAHAKLADQQSHGALVLGEWRPFAARDWSAQRCAVTIGAHTYVERRGTHPMADPAWVLPAWLRHACADGTVLAAGTVVTTGSWAGMLEARSGDEVDVEFEGIGRASVRV